MTFFNRASLQLTFALMSVAVLASGCKTEKEAGAGSPATFYFENVKAAQTLPLEFNSWGFPKKILYKLRACPKDIGLMGAIIGQDFEVRDESGAGQFLTTDPSGCLQWDETYEYDHFAPETFINVKRTIVGRGGHKGAVEVSLAVNPWAKTILDQRYETPQKLEKASQPVAFSAALVKGRPFSANIDLKNLSLQSLATDYEKWKVNPQLQLTVVHNYRLRFEPKVIRKALQTPTATDTPVQGKVRVTIVIAKEGQDATVVPEQYVTHLNATYDMQVGGVIEDVELDFAGTIADVASRMRAYVKITPLVDSPSVAPALLTGPIGPLPSQGSIQLVPTNVDAELLLAHVQVEKSSSATAKLKPIELFEQESGFRRLTEQDLNSSTGAVASAFTMAQAKSFLRGSEDSGLQAKLMNRLCHEVYGKVGEGTEEKQDDSKDDLDDDLADDGEEKKTSRWSWRKKRPTGQKRSQSLLANCLSHPRSMMLHEVRELVEDVTSPVPRRVGFFEAQTLTIQNSFSLTEATSKTKGTTKKNFLGYNIEVGAGGSWGWDLGKADEEYKTPDDPSKCGDSDEPPCPSDPILGMSGKRSHGVFAKLSAGGRGGRTVEKYWTTARSIDERSSTSVTAAMTRMVIVEAYAFDIDVMARKCMIVAPAVDVPGSSERGVFFCDDQIAKKTAREAYYFLNQSIASGSPFVDSASASEAMWRMFMRGSHVFNAFKRVVSDAKLELVLEPIDEKEIEKDTQLGKKAKEIFLSSTMTQDFPGLLSPAVAKKK